MSTFSRMSHVAGGLLAGMITVVVAFVGARGASEATPVDGNDFLIWQKGFTTSQSADFDHDGDVDGRDFLIWQRQSTSDPSCLTQCELKTAALWG